MTSIERVGVIGAGTMGWGIACALTRVASVGVVLLDINEAALQRARAAIAREHARTAPDEVDARMRALTTTTAYDDLAECHLVIEAAPEIEGLKRSVLAAASEVAPLAVVATNTSSLSVAGLSSSVTDPTRFLGVHFFNPAARMPLVEVIRSPQTDTGVIEAVKDFLTTQVGKEAIILDDRPGFAVNALLVPFLLAAARMAETGYATAEDIDRAMRLGAGHPMGPLALSDLIGLDVLCDIADAMYAQTGAPEHAAPPNLRRLVGEGAVGRKAGRGFHLYQAG